MPDDNRTPGPSNDAPRDPLDDLIAPILGRKVTPQPRNVPTLPESSKQSRRNPLDGLVTDAELRAEASKAAARSLALNKGRRNPLDDLLTDDDLRTESAPASTRTKRLKDDTPPRTLQTARRGAFKGFVISLLVIGALVGVKFVGGQAWNAWREQAPPKGKISNEAQSVRPLEKEPVGSSAATGKLSPKEVFDKLSPAVVRVNVYDARSKPIGHGSGFFVRDGATILSNRHVIAGASSAEVVLKDGTHLAVQGVEAVDETCDIAVLRVADAPKAIRYLTLGPTILPPVGEHVYVIGSPQGYDYTLSDGMVSGHHERDGQRWIQMTAPVSHGSSGSPVLGEDGSVLGIATWVDWGGQNLNFASPCGAITTVMTSKSKFQSLADLFAENKQRIVALRDKMWITGIAEVARILDSLPKSYRQLPEFWLLKGDIQKINVARKGIFESSNEALASYHQALLVDEKESEIWARIGKMHLYLAIMHMIHKPDEDATQRHYVEAMTAFQKGTATNDDDEVCWDGLGHSYLELKRPRDAAVALRRCLAINPKSFQTHGRLADALGELGDVEGAIAEYKAEVDLTSEMSDRYGPRFCVLPNYYLGRFLQKNGRHKEAIAAFEKALSFGADEKERQWCEEGLLTSRRIVALKKSN